MRKLDEVVEHVIQHGSYMPDAPNTPYWVRYPNHVNGKFFCASDTRELVIEIMKTCHPRANMEGY